VKSLKISHQPLQNNAKELLKQYATIPIHYKYNHVYDFARENGEYVKTLREVKLDFKEYDIINPPSTWIEKFDLTDWLLITIELNEIIIAGAVIAWKSDSMLDGRTDLGILWDIRVDPPYRRKLYGTILFQETEKWLLSKNCTELRVETQNINVFSCDFYEKMGCHVDNVIENAYPGLNEVMVIYSKSLKS